jgi:hypothetical protein
LLSHFFPSLFSLQFYLFPAFPILRYLAFLVAFNQLINSFFLSFLLPSFFSFSRSEQQHWHPQISRGQQYFRKNYFALFVAKLCGLLTILSIPSIVRVLMLTRQSRDPVTAFRRYVVTLTHMLEWYDGDLLEPTSG